jgi:hypothetical protein
MKSTNPLTYVAIGSGVVAALDFSRLAIHSDIEPLVFVRMVAYGLFFALYFRQSHYAWHIIFCLTTALVPLNFLCEYYGLASRHLSHLAICIWIPVVFGFLSYLWNIKERYFRYVER